MLNWPVLEKFSINLKIQIRLFDFFCTFCNVNRDELSILIQNRN